MTQEGKREVNESKTDNQCQYIDARSRYQILIILVANVALKDEEAQDCSRKVKGILTYSRWGRSLGRGNPQKADHRLSLQRPQMRTRGGEARTSELTGS